MAGPEDIRRQLHETDQSTLETRAERMSEVIDFSYEGAYSPVREYLEELDRLYINGHFMATIVFAGSVVEHLLRQKLYLVADVSRVDRATLGTLCNMARRKKVLSHVEYQRLEIIRSMRNLLVHTDTDSEFALEMMDAACPDIDDPYVKRTWFFHGSNFSLMAKTCAEIARSFAARAYENSG